MQRLPETLFDRLVILARRHSNGEWWSSTYGGKIERVWFFSTDMRPSFDRPAIVVAYFLDPDDADPPHQTGWWLAIVSLRTEAIPPASVR